MRLRTDLEQLAGVEGALLEAVRAAREMVAHSDEPPDPATGDGAEALRGAVERFIDGWSYGMGLVAADASKLASLLRSAAGAASPGLVQPGTGPSDAAKSSRNALQVSLTDDADRVEILATWLATCGEQAAAGADGLRGMDMQVWSGEGAGALGEAIAMLGSRLDMGAGAFREAASTLRACAGVLWEAQLRARQAGVVPASLYGGSGPSGGTLPEVGAPLDASALEELEDSRVLVGAAIHRAVGRLRLAADEAPRRPDSLAAAHNSTGGAAAEYWDSVWGLGLFTFEVTPSYELTYPQAYVEALKELEGEFLAQESRPVAFTDTTGWDAWLNHPTRAFGQLVPPRPEPPAEPEAPPVGSEAPAAHEEEPAGHEEEPVETGTPLEVPEEMAAQEEPVEAESAPDLAEEAMLDEEQAGIPIVQEHAGRAVPGEPAPEEEKRPGVRGLSSGRPFDPDQAGGPIRHLTSSRIRITPKGVAVVEQHVARYGPDEVDVAMVARLRRIAAGEIGATPTDRTFCAHQLRAFVRYRQLHHPTGDPGYEVWNNVHTAALEDYGVQEGPHVLYPVGDTMTDYEEAVLRAISSGRDPVRWYKIEQRLSVMPVETRSYLPDTLRHLRSRGLVQPGGEGGDGYELTAAGRQLLESQGP